ncbi:hypothetical protein [Stackebrandtia nassauensis]|uniref:Uncharacterized protein n=1 Tax=Stackebrandtia nassauensis (strain DSM 44728 / CIP 108903 / NRRL B-16338 / NBRC 102104 / LLR-40K-21) TaxID=446470 RepID=D3PUE8_STANL|nr:hypothetical protein [Stackebrandtia nassauensis]ADD42961.1 hypothetical protein Snas_3293 [Stackebrandtia nassauensis DSM 44728]
MRTLFDGEFNVSYGQLYLDGRIDPDEGAEPDLDNCFMGQTVGLMGAAIPGHLFVLTGTHSGSVPLTVEVHETEPSLDADAWEDVVEVSFESDADEVALIEWDGDFQSLDLSPGSYRVRYLCRGMDAASGHDRFDDDPVVDEYLLQFWPAPPQRDRIVKETSRSAAYWRRVAAEVPPPPSPEEVAEAKRIADERAAEKRRRYAERERWGEYSPSDRLRGLGGHVSKVAKRDPALAHATEAAGPDVQRAIACWAARRFCDATGLSDVDWIAEGLSQLERGVPLSPPLDDVEQTWRRFVEDPRVRDIVGPKLDRVPDAARQEMPFPALTEAAHPDPLRAAFDALWAASAGSGWRDVFTEVRERFPRLSAPPLPPEEPSRSQVSMTVVRRRASDEPR